MAIPLVVLLVGFVTPTILRDRLFHQDTPDRVWRLDKIPSTGLQVEARQTTASATVPFSFPDTAVANDASDQWWIARMGLRITFAAGESGTVIASMATAGRSTVQVKFVVDSDRRSVEVRSLSWLDGQVRRVVNGMSVSDVFRNYAQVGGVKPGRQAVRFSYQVLGNRSRLVESFTVLPSSAMERTRTSPYQMRLDVPLVVDSTPGTVNIPYTAFVRGQRPAGLVVLSVSEIVDSPDIEPFKTRIIR